MPLGRKARNHLNCFATGSCYISLRNLLFMLLIPLLSRLPCPLPSPFDISFKLSNFGQNNASMHPCTYTHTCIHTHMHMMHTHTWTHTHTHTHMPAYICILVSVGVLHTPSPGACTFKWCVGLHALMTPRAISVGVSHSWKALPSWTGLWGRGQTRVCTHAGPRSRKMLAFWAGCKSCIYVQR